MLHTPCNLLHVIWIPPECVQVALLGKAIKGGNQTERNPRHPVTKILCPTACDPKDKIWTWLYHNYSAFPTCPYTLPEYLDTMIGRFWTFCFSIPHFTCLGSMLHQFKISLRTGMGKQSIEKRINGNTIFMERTCFFPIITLVHILKKLHSFSLTFLSLKGSHAWLHESLTLHTLKSQNSWRNPNESLQRF